MSILEDNGIIATWMNYLYYEDKGDIYLGHKPLIPCGITNTDIYQPDKDWNQLMEVVERIEQEATVNIFGHVCHIKIFNDLGMLENEIWHTDETKHQAVYQAVLEYIKQQKEG